MSTLLIPADYQRFTGEPPWVCAECDVAYHGDPASFRGSIEGSGMCASCEAKLPVCDCCGEPSLGLTAVEDRDDSAGYHATERLCEICVKGVGVL